MRKQLCLIHHDCKMYEKCFYFLLNSIFSGKMEFLTKLTLIQPNTPMHYNHYSAPTFLILFKKFLSLPPFTTEGRDDAFFTRDYKGETIKLLTFYMTDFLFTEP